MTEDAWLIACVSVVWAVLAALYAFVPLFHMPGSAQVWGAGALIFVALAILIARVEAKGRRRHMQMDHGEGSADGMDHGMQH
jgi:hypothetical protein